MNKKLSIIIPCYNCSATLGAAVATCFEQGLSEDEYEIILVDDASTDNTRSIMDAFRDQHPHLRTLYHSHNQGGGATRNTGMEAAAAPVLFCLDSDDLLPPGTLTKLLQYMEENKADGVGLAQSTKFRGDNPSDIAYVTYFSHPGEPVSLEHLLQRNSEWCSLYSVFMLSKEAFLKAGGYPTTHGFDTQGFAWRFVAAGLKAYTCPNTNYLHRVHHSHSYYLREYDSGRANINWQYIFLEHIHLFHPLAQSFIKNYNVTDFTKSFFTDLCTLEPVFQPPSERRYGISHIPQNYYQPKPVPRNSPRGIYYRLKHRLRHALYPR